MKMCTLPYGIAITVPKNDHVGRVYESGRFYEDRMLEYIRTHFPAGLRYVDAGALFGGHSLFFAEACGAASVHAFEPNREAYAYLAMNTAYRKDAITAHHSALGATCSRGEMAVVDGDNMGGAVFRFEREGGVVMTVLDGAVDRADVIKIDVEGMGADVIRGGIGLIGRCRPALFVECRDNTEREAVEAELLPLGYAAAQVFNHTPTYLFEAA